ncbi:gamma-glutamyltransferase [Altererythrobacter sp. Root672]|uniref:gamma-glutamyltransferase n=1 Tax=Altererythrobacter sp. Root672 TaxID=1736584 RepID=UPI0006F292E1|nr:gamma-glutamyltransferase [Altererythrobacter sp. Root672]KRA81588.1 gamma-glutamyltranspeptidase [Altererythrobacter sp. Root672]
MPNRLLLPLAVLLLGACATVPAPAKTADAKTAGVVSAADPRAAEAGVAMLRQGGSSTDAAIATMLALTVVEPQSSGIGGGGFMMHSAPDGDIQTFDGRETAPSGADPQWFLDADGKPVPFMSAVISGLSVGVPGNVRLAAEAHERYGKLSWAALFQPAIKLARDGWVLSERGRQFLVQSKNRAAHQSEALAIYYDASGEALPVGSVLRNPALAETLEHLAEQGPEWFYSGTNAAQIAAEIAAETPRSGAMTVADVAAYQAKDRPELCGPYRGYRICGMGPPSSGATTVYAILKQLERFDLGALGKDSPVFWHLFAESQRLAFADRERYLADPDFVSVPAEGLMEPDYLAGRGALIDPNSTLAQVTAGMPRGLALAPPDGTEPEEHGTSHFVAVDREGSAVSYTSTVEGSFGSGIMVGGYYLNNELTDFSFAPSVDGRLVANRVEGGKRPRSSMAPTLVYDSQGRLVLVIGAAGGATIPVQVARALIGVIDFGLPLDQAIALPVLFAPGDQLSAEEGSALVPLIPQLQALGHAQIATRSLPLKTNGAQRTAAGWAGAADPRSEGMAIGE